MNPDLIILGKDPDAFDEYDIYSRWLVECPICGRVRSVSYMGMYMATRRDHSHCRSCSQIQSIKNIPERIVIVKQLAGYNNAGLPLALVECPDCHRQRLMLRGNICVCQSTRCHVCSSTGKRNANWKGGHRYYYGPDWLGLARRIRERDFDTCQFPGCELASQDVGRALDVHHIVPYCETQDNSEYNLITLCSSHHAWADAHSNESIPMFDAIISTIYHNGW